MNLISVLLQQLDRSSPGSVETAKQVIGMLNGAAPETALFFGDDTYTPRLISEKFGCRLCAALTISAPSKERRQALTAVQFSSLSFPAVATI